MRYRLAAGLLLLALAGAGGSSSAEDTVEGGGNAHEDECVAAPVRWGPWGEGHRVIWKRSMDAISVTDVLAAVEQSLKEQRQQSAPI